MCGEERGCLGDRPTTRGNLPARTCPSCALQVSAVHRPKSKHQLRFEPKTIGSQQSRAHHAQCAIALYAACLHARHAVVEARPLRAGDRLVEAQVAQHLLQRVERRARVVHQKVRGAAATRRQAEARRHCATSNNNNKTAGLSDDERVKRERRPKMRRSLRAMANISSSSASSASSPSSAVAVEAADDED